MAGSRSPRLSRESVMRAALQLLGEVGIDGLSTRRLAERLGVQSPTLYWHFRNKGELLAAMAEAIMRERHRQPLPAPGQSWQAWFIANAHSFRQALLEYRDGARLHAGTRPRGEVFGDVEAKLGVLVDAGFAPAQAIELLLAVSRFVVGWVLEEQAAPAAAPVTGEAPDAARYPLAAQGWAALAEESADQVFDRQLRLFVAGAEAMAGQSRGAG
ncbi:tetracycline resistance transcriptional repressor TetR [Stenotrophomonas mori]|uniref:Tetracycline resistance transcriptional repressor TetR n=1 Tax=Stenotrophomonas mori TaxID=2871096 RepID=A0ABT0SJU0_9GAMM|nr:tetracycline resistance transcriptional repressor TetR [Stenotrophomonas mori]MCL7715602.1 tetracycline resistance transcriptional repressor TetR [Stenotrophomonas mori]